jgi:hypothetical protein
MRQPLLRGYQTCTTGECLAGSAAPNQKQKNKHGSSRYQGWNASQGTWTAREQGDELRENSGRRRACGGRQGRVLLEGIKAATGASR